jgi:hypothetical protein
MPVISTLKQQSIGNANTIGHLGSTLPIEISNRVWQFLPLFDLIAYGNTSGVNRIHIQDFIRRATNDEIRIFFNDPQAFQGVLWQTRSVISGSVALASLFPYQLRKWDPDDMDIYTTRKGFTRILNYVVTAGYKIVGQRTTRNTAYSGGSAIFEVVKLEDVRGRKLDIVVSNCITALAPVFEYYASHVVNCITGRGIYSAYPYHTLVGRAIMNGPSAVAPFYAMSTVLQKCIVKYARRGFTFQMNPVVALVAPHVCGSAKYCPHTVRNVFDGGALVVAFNNTNASSPFLRNSMRKIWRPRMANLWVFGGNACNVDEGTDITSPGFAAEVYL